MRPPPPPPPKKGSENEANNNLSESSVTSSVNSAASRPAAPPPPPKRTSLAQNDQPTESRPAAPAPPPKRNPSENVSASESSDATTRPSQAPKKPPRPSEVKTVPVDKALESVLDHKKGLEEPMIGKSNSQNPFGEEPEPNRSTISTQDSSKRQSTLVPLKDTHDVENNNYQGGSSPSSRSLMEHAVTLSKGEPENMIYHKTTFSEGWFVIFLLIHTIQFALLITAANDQIPTGAMAVIVILVVSVMCLVIAARFHVTKSRLSSRRNIKLRQGVCTPDDEADTIPDRAVYLIGAACVIEGIAYAIFAATVAGRSSHLNNTGYYTQDTILQILRFASIVLLSLHRILRPANRIDPMRTILELEVVAVCWDAIDGSTVYELLDGATIQPALASAARVLMAVWYVSVGFRMFLMCMTHLAPNNPVYQRLTTLPLQLAPQPTVDRTLQGLRLRAMVIMTMAVADIYAVIIRVILWSRHELNALQQEMLIKNFLFLAACSSAYDMYACTITRNWNSRVLDFIFFTVKYPPREKQLWWYRWAFIVCYMTISVCLTIILVNVSPDTNKWTGNIAMDIILCLIFIFYCENIFIKADFNEPTWFFIPKQKFFVFPFKLAVLLGGLMAISLLGARIPALYYSYNSFATEGVLWTYANAMLCVSLAILPISFFTLYWATGYMLFRREFTAVPGNYNAIHDPAIQMMATATMTEGALDILSCATLMQLAGNSLPSQMNGAIVLFCLLEVFNGCQSFALQVTLSGGHDDTPLDLVRWNAFFRVIRVLIDAGAIILRVVLWVQYNAVSSVFLVKNIYNLIHTITQIERWKGVARYPKDILFSQYVPAQDWYGLTMEQWRKETSDTIALQARAGRRV